MVFKAIESDSKIRFSNSGALKTLKNIPLIEWEKTSH